MIADFFKSTIWIYLLGVILLDLHLMTVQLEIPLVYQSLLPFFDILLIFLTIYVAGRGNNSFFIIPLFLAFVPLGIMVISFKELILSEYYFWAHLVKTLFFLTFLNKVVRKDILPSKKDSRFFFFFFLLLLILPNLFFIWTDFTPPTWDPSRHGRNALQIFHMLFEDKVGLSEGLMFYNFYPNVSYFVALPFVLLFGKSNDALSLSLIFFWLPISFYYTKKIINEIFKVSEEEAVLISFIYHSNFLYLSLYKQFLLDFQMVALLPVYYYYNWKSAFFNNKKFSLIAGLILGIGFLVKQIFLIFAGPGLLVMGAKLLWNTWKNRKSNKPFYISKWKNLLLHGAVALAVIIPWFGGWHFMYTFEVATHVDVAKGEGDPEPVSLASLIWYFPGFLYTYTWPVVLLLFYGWYSLLKVKRFNIHKYYALISIVIIFIALTLNYNKDLRYIIGIFFFLGFGFFGLAFINVKMRKIILLGTTLLCFGFSINLVSWKKLNVPGVTFDSYALPSAPQPPITHDESQALVFFEKMFSEQPIPVEKKVLHYQQLKEDNLFNYYSHSSQRSIQNVAGPAKYDSVLNKDEKFTELYRTDYHILSAPVTDSNTYYLYGRDTNYPSYYLLAFTIGKDKGVLRIAGFEGIVRSNLLLSINKFIGDSLAEHQDTWIAYDNIHISVPSNITKMEIGIHAFHANERWPFIYLNKFTPYFNNNYITNSFTPFSKDVNQFKNWIISLK